MKRKIVIIFLLCNLFCCFANDALEEDLSYLKLVFENCYAGYEYNLKQGFDSQKAINEIREQYYIQAGKKEKINTYVLTDCIDNYFIKKLPVFDAHLSVSSSGHPFFPALETFYWALINFEKRGNEYFVTRNFVKGVKRNDKYTGDPANIFKVNDNKYIFGFFSDNKKSDPPLSINNKDFQFKKRLCHKIINNELVFGVRTTEKSIYLSLSDCDFASNNKKLHFQIEQQIKENIATLRKGNFENVIIDLRGNTGGQVTNVIPLVKAINHIDSYEDENDVDKKIKSIQRGEKTVYSPEMIPAIQEYIKRHPGFGYKSPDFEEYKSTHIECNNTEYFKFIPKFKGKLFILTDTNTASAAEELIAYLSIYDDITIIGSNTWGCADFGSVLEYFLPNSKIKLTLASRSMNNMSAFRNNYRWKGDGKGFYPDYWVFSGSYLDKLMQFANDKKLKIKLKRLDKGLLKSN